METTTHQVSSKIKQAPELNEQYERAIRIKALMDYLSSSVDGIQQPDTIVAMIKENTKGEKIGQNYVSVDGYKKDLLNSFNLIDVIKDQLDVVGEKLADALEYIEEFTDYRDDVKTN
jgi:uncharacterized coiled-coil DUF342 family protein